MCRKLDKKSQIHEMQLHFLPFAFASGNENTDAYQAQWARTLSYQLSCWKCTFINTNDNLMNQRNLSLPSLIKDRNHCII